MPTRRSAKGVVRTTPAAAACLNSVLRRGKQNNPDPGCALPGFGWRSIPPVWCHQPNHSNKPVNSLPSVFCPRALGSAPPCRLLLEGDLGPAVFQLLPHLLRVFLADVFLDGLGGPLD